MAKDGCNEFAASVGGIDMYAINEDDMTGAIDEDKYDYLVFNYKQVFSCITFNPDFHGHTYPAYNRWRTDEYYSPYALVCNFIDCDEIAYDGNDDFYFCYSCLQDDQMILDANNEHQMYAFQPTAHYNFQANCYEDCELIEGANLVNGEDGYCDCKEGYGWYDDPYFSDCVSCNEMFPGCGECDFED